MWAVDRIVGHRIRHRHHEYAVRWSSTGAGHDQWQRIDSFHDGNETSELDFENRRLGDNRHVDAAAAAVSYNIGPSGTEVSHPDGWDIYFAHDNDSLLKIGRQHQMDPKILLDFSLGLYSCTGPQVQAGARFRYSDSFACHAGA
jgi:hypothetical protein